MVLQIPNKERRNLSAVAHEMTMIRGLPLHIGFFMGWADRFRPSLSSQSLNALDFSPSSIPNPPRTEVLDSISKRHLARQFVHFRRPPPGLRFQSLFLQLLLRERTESTSVDFIGRDSD